MSPRESAVKISYLFVLPHMKVHARENEQGSHDMLSLQMGRRPHIGWCGEKDSAFSAAKFFWLTRAAGPEMGLRLTY
ncbi:hypothetical protein SAMN02927924_00497 [Sphingobium faniae]|nr:hypothetical protein SAMN02927924_00497 [Sphingobium faniae]